MAVRTIGTDIKLTGEKEFNDGMKAINNNLKTLRSDMAVVAATFEDNANSVEALASKHRLLNDILGVQSDKVDALQAMYDKAAEKYGKNSAEADKYKQQLNAATVAMIKTTRELDKVNAALESAREAAIAADQPVEEITDAMQEVAEAADAAENSVEDLSDANKKVGRTAQQAADELEDMSDKTDRANKLFPAMASGAGAAVRGLGGLASGALQAGAAVVSLGAAMGTAAITALVSFAKESAEAAKAAAEAGETLTETQQTWLDYADKLDVLDDAAAKAKRALGGVLLPQLSALSTDGSKYLNSFAQSMEEASGDSERQAQVLSEYLVKGVRLIKDNLPEYIQVGKDLWGGIKKGIREVAPELMDEGIDLAFDLLESILDSADEFDAGGQMLFDKLKAGLEGRGPEIVTSSVSILTNFIVGLTENAVDLLPVAGTLILTLVSGLADALPELGTAAGKAIGELVTFLLNPENLGKVAEAAWDIGSAFATALWNAAKEVFASLVDLNDMFGPISGDLGFQMSTGNFNPNLSIPGYADGLERVPFDNFLARLHKDEMVLTAAEAALYRAGRGPGGGVSYNNLNMPIYVQQLTTEQLEEIYDYVNGRLGDGM